MTTLDRVHARSIEMMELTVKTLGQLLRAVSRETATTLRDGPGGWTVLEVVCHLRDFDRLFRDRVRLSLEHEGAAWPPFDPDRMAAEGRYNEQDLATALADLAEHRGAFVAALRALSPEEWARGGVHPHRGPETLTDVAHNTARHDILHLEQISRILVEGVRG